MAMEDGEAKKSSRAPLSEAEIAERLAKLNAIVARFDAIPTVDHRSADEIIGYNEKGHFD